MKDSDRIGVDLTKFAKKHTLGDVENRLLYRTSMLQEQIDHLGNLIVKQTLVRGPEADRLEGKRAN